MLFFRSKRVPLDEQLAQLAEAGVTPGDGVVREDLLSFETEEELEKAPYQGIIEVLGIDLEREPYTPICHRLWMCDYERIEDHGSYADILTRLELMTDGALGLTEIRDHVDIGEESAWVEFTCDGERIRWDPEVNDDWMDPVVIVNYDRLLKAKGKTLRLYSNHEDFGQSALFAAFSAEDFRKFDALSKVKLLSTESQA